MGIHFNDICTLFDINNVQYRLSNIYDEKNNPYKCIWLTNGHLEFDENDCLNNVVTY